MSKEHQIPTLCVVIVNYRTPQLVADCLASLLPELEGIRAQVVVVDNCSGDESLDFLSDWISSHGRRGVVRLVQSETNSGFSGGNNIGIWEIEADHYLLLNSDTLVRPGAIATMLQTAKTHPRAGLVSPRLEWPDGTTQESCFRYLTPVSEFINAAQTGPVTVLLKTFNVPLPVSTNIIMPDWTSFACVLIRRQVFDDIGLMDEGFFLYFEDVEFCLRAQKAGWSIVHNPEARVVHLRGGSSPVKEQVKECKRLPPYYYASRARYFYLAYGQAGLTLANMLWSLGRCVSKGRELMERRERGMAQKQWLDIWTNWFKPDAPRLGGKKS